MAKDVVNGIALLLVILYAVIEQDTFPKYINSACTHAIINCVYTPVTKRVC